MIRNHILKFAQMIEGLGGSDEVYFGIASENRPKIIASSRLQVICFLIRSI